MTIALNRNEKTKKGELFPPNDPSNTVPNEANDCKDVPDATPCKEKAMIEGYNNRNSSGGFGSTVLFQCVKPNRYRQVSNLIQLKLLISLDRPKPLELLPFSLVLGLIGMVCLVWPSKIQQYALRSPAASKFNPFFEWMKKPSYLVSLRLCGVLALLMATLIIWAAISNRG